MEVERERDLLKAQLEALLEALPFAGWFMDREGEFRQTNRVFRNSMNSDLQQEVKNQGNETFQTGKPNQATHSARGRVFKTVSYPVYSNDRNIELTGGYQEDITNLSNSLQALHREREYLEALLEYMPFYIFFTDRYHRYLRVNSRMGRLLRVSDPDEAAGMGNDAFFTRRVARKMLEEDRQIQETGNPIINKIIFFEDDGVEGFWMEKNKIPIFDERGVVTMIVGLFRDVSDMMRIENELKSARDRAEKSDRLKTAFLANMSHEIRTPMNGILGFANLLRDPGLTEEQHDTYLKHIETSSRQLLNIIDDILDISKIESGQLKISNRPTRINSIMDEIYSLYFHRIRGDAPGQKKVSFNLEKGNPSGDFTIVTDAYRLRQIFNNLLNNSLKFTSEGRVDFGYKIRNNRHIEFFVSDTGIGIPREQMPVIFNQFGQVDSGNTYRPSGTGLGLPISKSLVNLMGGEMWVDSEEGKGTTFYFTLPLVTEATVEEAPVLISHKSYNWAGKVILVAEDEELNWHFIREILRKSGAEILRAKDGNEVVALAREKKPHIILMDIKMPEVNGFEATRQIRDLDTTVPIIAQSAYVMAEEKEESLRAGCNKFVTKPIDRTTIMELIDGFFKKEE